MTATRETFVFISNGDIVEAWTDGRKVTDAPPTKEGNLPKNRRAFWLPYRDSDEGKAYLGPIARFEEKTEEKAEPIRQYIAQLREELRQAQVALEACYHHQATVLKD